MTLARETPLVSVITPTYNQAPYLRDCLQSVVDQTYTNWEQVIVDDGSSDATTSIAERYLSDRTRLVRRSHRGITGLADAYNTGLNLSNGDLIAILEGDDAWPSSKLENQIRTFQSSDVILSWGAGTMIDANGNSLGAIRPIRTGSTRVVYFDASAIARKIMVENIIVPSSGVVIRRAALARIGGFHQPVGIPYADLPTWLHLSTETGPSEVFAYTKDTVAYWRSHPQQASRAYETMTVAHATLVTEFVQQLASDPQRSRSDREFHLALSCYLHAKAALAQRNWRAAERNLRTGWVVKDTSLRWLLVLVGISALTRVDLFRFTNRISRRGSMRGILPG